MVFWDAIILSLMIELSITIYRSFELKLDPIDASLGMTVGFRAPRFVGLRPDRVDPSHNGTSAEYRKRRRSTRCRIERERVLRVDSGPPPAVWRKGEALPAAFWNADLRRLDCGDGAAAIGKDNNIKML
jgi:hypothetical protein